MPKTGNAFPIDILIKESSWSSVTPNLENYCADIIVKTYTSLDNPKAGEVSVALINDDEMQLLNAQYRGKDMPTNVLSFPDAGPALMLGDIVIAYETTKTEAHDSGKSLKDHLTHLLIHGFLHLQGYDHKNDTDAAIMEKHEVAILAELNIDNPYKIQDFRHT